MSFDVDGLSLTGTAAVEFNTTGAVQLASLTVGGQAMSISVGKAQLAVTIQGAALSAGPLRFSAASLAFIQGAAGEIQASGSGLTVELFVGDRRVIRSHRCSLRRGAA